MSVMDTAPARLALMAKDCDSRVKHVEAAYVEALDAIDLPAIVIDDADAMYENLSEMTTDDQETFSLKVISRKLSSAPNGKTVHNELREIVQSLVLYLKQHPRLQMSNGRGLHGSALTELEGIMGTPVIRRSAIVLDDQYNWFHCDVDITVRSFNNAPQAF